MKVNILVDNPGSWIVPYARDFQGRLERDGHAVTYSERAEDVPEGDVALFLSCEKIVPADIRCRNKHNLVVHESDLPRGKGWSPLTWQILQGKNKITVTLFEAADKVDAGDIHATRTIEFDGTELVDELRAKQWDATEALISGFLKDPDMKPRPQSGEEGFYERRSAKDSELGTSKTLAELFDVLRVVDNERYPAFFTHKGRSYILKIYPKE